MRIASAVTAVLMLGMPLVIRAQAPTATGVLRGVVFDSLFGRRPLEAADVWIDGVPGIVETDATGRFTITAVPVGSHRVSFSHPTLEQVGFEPRPVTILVTANTETPILLSTPAPTTLYTLLCGDRPGGDVGMILGVVRELGSQAAVPVARVVASWNQLHFVDGRAALVRPDVLGKPVNSVGYVVCGVPTDAEVQLTAFTTDGRAGVVPHALNGAVASPRSIGVVAVRPQERGLLTGVVVSDDGVPIINARIMRAGDSTGVTTDSTGRFPWPDLPRDQGDLSIRALGWYPLLWSGAPSAPRQFTFALSSIGDVLARIDVRSRRLASEAPPEFDARRRRGFGTFFTRDDIERLRPTETTQLVARAPGMVVMADGRVVTARSLATGGCPAAVYLDGLPFLTGPREFPPLQMITPDVIAGVEVYRGIEAPMPFSGPCGSIVIWTRRGGRTTAR